MSASHHMLRAPEAPAPTAMQSRAVKAMTGCTSPGARTRPTSAVKITSDMTRGFSSWKKSSGWASVTRNPQLVAGALLVAPGDPEREELRVPLRSWSPVVRQTLPFPSILLGSHDDPYCSFERAQGFAQSWGSTFVDYGQRGHINAESGLGDWPEGLELLAQVVNNDYLK